MIAAVALPLTTSSKPFGPSPGSPPAGGLHGRSLPCRWMTPWHWY